MYLQNKIAYKITSKMAFQKTLFQKKLEEKLEKIILQMLLICNWLHGNDAEKKYFNIESFLYKLSYLKNFNNYIKDNSDTIFNEYFGESVISIKQSKRLNHCV